MIGYKVIREIHGKLYSMNAMMMFLNQELISGRIIEYFVDKEVSPVCYDKPLFVFDTLTNLYKFLNPLSHDKLYVYSCDFVKSKITYEEYCPTYRRIAGTVLADKVKLLERIV